MQAADYQECGRIVQQRPAGRVRSHHAAMASRAGAKSYFFRISHPLFCRSRSPENMTEKTRCEKMNNPVFRTLPIQARIE